MSMELKGFRLSEKNAGGVNPGYERRGKEGSQDALRNTSCLATKVKLALQYILHFELLSKRYCCEAFSFLGK